jgi:F-type H+-transporting ATPase subunit delta
MLSSVAMKYARALVEIAAEKDEKGEVYLQVRALGNLLETHSELRETLLSPVVSFASKRKIIEALAVRIPLGDSVRNFTLLILKNGRMKHFPRFVSAVRDVLDELEGVVRAGVYSTHTVADEVKPQLRKAVRDLTGKEVRLDFHEDSELLGGLKLQIGSEIYDGSIRAQLDRIQKTLAES